MLWIALGVLAAVVVLALVIVGVLHVASRGLKVLNERADRRDTARRLAAHKRVVSQFETCQMPAIVDETPGGPGWTPDPARLTGFHTTAPVASALTPARGRPVPVSNAPAGPVPGRAESTGRHHLADSALGRCAPWLVPPEAQMRRAG